MVDQYLHLKQLTGCLADIVSLLGRFVMVFLAPNHQPNTVHHPNIAPMHSDPVAGGDEQRRAAVFGGEICLGAEAEQMLDLKSKALHGSGNGSGHETHKTACRRTR